MKIDSKLAVSCVHDSIPCRIQCFCKKRMYDVFYPEFSHSYTQNAYCAIKMLFKTAHTNNWLERFFMFASSRSQFSVDFFFLFSLSQSFLLLLQNYVCKISTLFYSCCQVMLVRCLSVGRFFFGINTIFRVEFVNKQIKVKDHIKKRYTQYIYIHILHM